MAVFVFVLGAVVGMAALLFALENMEPVTLRYLFHWQTQPIPFSYVIMTAVGVGFVVAGLFGMAAYLRKRRTIRQQQRTIAQLQAELLAQRLPRLDTAVEQGSRGSAASVKPADTTGELPPR
jgi:uncharacterized integral membrane protein